jgi:hypothetical protein
MTVNRLFFKLFALFASASIVVSCNKSPSYFGMLNRDKMYYFRIAESCNELLVKTNYVSSPETIRGDDPSLPKPLKELHATKIEVKRHFMVGTDDVSEVLIIFGEGRPDYIVSWGHTDYGNGYRPWQLAVAGEEVGKIVFSTTNLAVFGTNSAN